MTTDEALRQLSREKIGFILASASPARLATLRAAGIEPEVLISDIDEGSIIDEIRRSANGRIQPSIEVMALADAKGQAVQKLLESATLHKSASTRKIDHWLLVSCDSMLEFDGSLEGKPHTPEIAFERIMEMQGKDATLWTGHRVALLHYSDLEDQWTEVAAKTAAEATIVHFGSMTPDEIRAYVATGEPLEVAGAFTIDGLGGAFLDGVTGDPHSVVGISLPVVRRLARELGVFWPSLWNCTQRSEGKE